MSSKTELWFKKKRQILAVTEAKRANQRGGSGHHSSLKKTNLTKQGVGQGSKRAAHNL